jgi:NAD(P)-dependent dehydrogenase (short-subunit alcohol dehydrogenase family)
MRRSQSHAQRSHPRPHRAERNLPRIHHSLFGHTTRYDYTVAHQGVTMKNIVLVTGSLGNLGQAVVQKFAALGDTVIGTIAEHEAAHSPQSPLGHQRSVIDLLDETASTNFVRSIVFSHQRIDVAVLTVGGFAMGSIAETSTADIAAQYRLNFETAYNIARPVFMQMMKQGSGRIFLIGSRPATSAALSRGMTAYGLAKSLVFRLAEMMNEEAKAANNADVVTTVIAPSIIDTPQNRAAMPNADFTKWVTAQDIANLIAYHASPEARALRETVIKAYGGV